jgi:hypothetical protein
LTPKEKHAHLLPNALPKLGKKREKKKKKNTQTTQQVLHNVDFIVTHLCKSFSSFPLVGERSFKYFNFGGEGKENLLLTFFFSFHFFFSLPFMAGFCKSSKVV